jgi:hypothetical protein
MGGGAKQRVYVAEGNPGKIAKVLMNAANRGPKSKRPLSPKASLNTITSASAVTGSRFHEAFVCPSRNTLVANPRHAL